MAEHGPSEKAVQAAAKFACPDPDHGDVSLSLKAAHDPALGLDRSVCLRDVMELIHNQPWSSLDHDRLVAQLQRVFTESSSPDREGAEP